MHWPNITKDSGPSVKPHNIVWTHRHAKSPCKRPFEAHSEGTGAGTLTATELASILGADLHAVRGALFHLSRAGRIKKAVVKRCHEGGARRVFWLGANVEPPSDSWDTKNGPKSSAGSGVVAGPLLVRGYRWGWGSSLR